MRRYPRHRYPVRRYAYRRARRSWARALGLVLVGICLACGAWALLEGVIWPEEGDRVSSDGSLTMDYSHASQGYVLARASSSKRLKLRVSKGDTTLTYDLNGEGEYEVFPLQLGDGKYSWTLYENVTGNSYAQAGGMSFSVELEDANAPFLGIGEGAGAQNAVVVMDAAAAQLGGYAIDEQAPLGIDSNKLIVLIAVLEKRLGMKMFQKDVFLNFAGGFKVADPGLDLAVVAAVISSYYDRPIAEGVCCAGEVGLSGEVRPAPRTEQRISEAARLGFRKIIVSGYLSKEARRPKGIEIVPITGIDQLPRALFVE